MVLSSYCHIVCGLYIINLHVSPYVLYRTICNYEYTYDHEECYVICIYDAIRIHLVQVSVRNRTVVTVDQNVLHFNTVLCFYR